MATSLLLRASDPNKTHNNTMKPLGTAEETKPESSRNKGRRANAKAPNQKKQPQRGLGVAQLERLRLQESLKMGEQTSPLQPFSSPAFPFTVHDHFGGVPSRYGVAANHGAFQGPQPVINGSAVGVGAQVMGNRGGFNVLGGSGGGAGGASSGFVGWPVANRVNMMEPFGFGAPGSSVLVGSPFEASKELSSMPNMDSPSNRCDTCHKKKRCSVDNVTGSDTWRDSSSDKWPINGSDFLGFRPQQPPNLNGEITDDFSTRSAGLASPYAARNPDEVVEVVAIHRKGDAMNGRIFMEYEFFPEKDGRGTASKELELPTSVAASVGGEASSVTAAFHGDPTDPNFIDLSLRLSC